MKKINYYLFLKSLLICFSAAIVGSIVTYPAISTWYAFLHKPFFSPPNWIFGPVWTTLYILMGISLYIVWVKKSNKKMKQQALLFFYIQLFLNALWSILFFGLHSPILGFITIIFLWLSIVLTIKYFLKLSETAAFLLFPYILWVSFALILNFSIVLLNK